jgi:hypothetical protein
MENDIRRNEKTGEKLKAKGVKFYFRFINSKRLFPRNLGSLFSLSVLLSEL